MVGFLFSDVKFDVEEFRHGALFDDLGPGKGFLHLVNAQVGILLPMVDHLLFPNNYNYCTNQKRSKITAWIP